MSDKLIEMFATLVRDPDEHADSILHPERLLERVPMSAEAFEAFTSGERARIHKLLAKPKKTDEA
jgi:hypothetical protein